MKTVCFLPCRKGSQRVPHKNIRPFAGYEFGLIEIKLRQLLAAQLIDEIVLSTNDEEIISYAESLSNQKITIHKRDEALAGNLTSTDALVGHVTDLIPAGHVLWTHVTSPFVTAALYDEIIKSYQEALEKGYDSLMTTTLINGFIWSEQGPVNYDRQEEKWPRTQTITPLHEINSAAFLNSIDNYKNLNDRIGNKPYLYAMDKIKSFDIDWQDDFTIAEQVLKSGIVTL